MFLFFSMAHLLLCIFILIIAFVSWPWLFVLLVILQMECLQKEKKKSWKWNNIQSASEGCWVQKWGQFFVTDFRFCTFIKFIRGIAHISSYLPGLAFLRVCASLTLYFFSGRTIFNLNLPLCVGLDAYVFTIESKYPRENHWQCPIFVHQIIKI